MRSSLLSLSIVCICANIFAYETQPIQETFQDLPTPDMLLSDRDEIFLLENPTLACVYIPEHIKTAIIQLHDHYRDLTTHIDLSLFTDPTIHVASYDIVKQRIHELLNLLTQVDIKKNNSDDTIFDSIMHYVHILRTGGTRITLEELKILQKKQDALLEQNIHLLIRKFGLSRLHSTRNI